MFPEVSHRFPWQTHQGKYRGGDVKDATSDRFAVAIVTDHAVLADGLGMVLCMQDGIEVLGVVDCAADAITLASARRPDVLIVDASLPAAELDQLLRAACSGGLGAPLLLLSDEPSATGLPAGAEAVLSKRVTGRQLAGAVRAIVAGQRHLLSGIVAATREPEPRGRRRDPFQVRLDELTRRERQVLAMIASGYSNRRIAAECVLSLNTVRAHVQNVLIKLGVHSRLEAVAFAVPRGISGVGRG